MIAAMQLIPHTRTRPARPLRLSLVTGSIVGAILLFGGLILGWLAYTTPLMVRLIPVGRPEPAQVAVAITAWAVALIAPGTFVIVGLARIYFTFASVSATRPRPSLVSRLGVKLGDDYLVAERVRLPDGHVVQQLVVGPFGAAVIEELPPREASRHHGQTWEVRGPRGVWVPMENPLERAARDAERVRRWFAHDDSDFLVKTYAAVIGDPSIPRIPTCASIAADQVTSWLSSLPAQRSLSADRRELLATLIAETR